MSCYRNINNKKCSCTCKNSLDKDCMSCFETFSDDSCNKNESSCNSCKGTYCNKITCLYLSNNSLNIGLIDRYKCNPLNGTCEISNDCTGISLNDCKSSCNKYLYSCVKGKGCIQTEDGKLTKSECESTCKMWECDLDKGCSYSSSFGDYLTKSDCIEGCKGYSCVKGFGCITDPESDQHYAQCEKACLFWGCDTGCITKTKFGLFDNKGDCNSSCKPWVCSTDECIHLKSGNGSFSSKAECESNCTSWNCSSEGCNIQKGNGGDFSSKAECESNCNNNKVYECIDKPVFSFLSQNQLDNNLQSNYENIETNFGNNIKEINIDKNNLSISYKHESKYPLGYVSLSEELTDSSPQKKEYYIKLPNEIKKMEDELINNNQSILESFNDSYLNWACNNCNRLNKSLCGAIKNQGTCGTCWIFGTTAVMESYISKNEIENNSSKNYVSLSEQYVSNIVMTSPEHNQYGHSCCGSHFYYCVDLINSIGITNTNECPYKNNSCSTSAITNCNLEEHSDKCVFTPSNKPGCQLSIPNSDRVLDRNNNLSIFILFGGGDYLTNDHIKKLLHIYGPLVTSSFGKYVFKPNIVSPIDIYYPRTSNNQINHQITLVGYGKTSDNKPYWIIRNSWGNVGTNGYMAIEMVPEGPNRIFGDYGAIINMDYNKNFVTDNTVNETLS